MGAASDDGRERATAVDDNQLVKAYVRSFGRPYLEADIFERYPETRIIPAYIKSHFPHARHVLDLGFGTGLWFWASFLPALQRIDGMDLYPEALAEADLAFSGDGVPAGFRLAHAAIGSCFTMADLQALAGKRGRFFFQDYRQAWPSAIADARYDLVTEHGGGIGQMSSDAEVIEVVRRAAGVLLPGGHFLFANFVMRASGLERQVGRVPSPAFRLRPRLLHTAVQQAGLSMVDFHTLQEPAGMPDVRTFIYGYAEKPAGAPDRGAQTA